MIGMLAVAAAMLAQPGIDDARAIEREAPAACPSTSAPLPPALAAWAQRVPLAAGTSGADAPPLALDRGVELALLPTPRVAYPLRPSHPGGTVSHGGLVALTVLAAATYRVAIGSAAWIDVVRDGAAVESSAHGPGPACSGVRKMVDFPLLPGRYVLQIAGNGGASLPVLVTRLP